MERHRREERGQHKHQSKTADTHRGERKHQSSTNATGRGHRREELKIQERHYSPELLPTVTALSGDDNYVRRWLAKTEAETKQERAGHRRHSDSIPKAINDHQSRDNHIFHQQTHPVDPTPDRKRKRMHKSSIDSSLLASPPKQPTREFVYRESSPPSKRKQEKQKDKLPKPERPQSSEPSSRPASEFFRKRARHKTREDRYEPKNAASKSNKKNDEPKRKPSKKAANDGQKKVAKKSSGELMNNFTSDKIAHERLTMRPPHGPGIFTNGKASSQVRRRGVPDLVFSEMDFLQHANRYQAFEKEAQVSSKSREKERRKALKVRQNISTYFKVNRAPLQDVERSSLHTSSVYSKQLDLDRREGKQEKENRVNRHRAQSFGSPRRAYVELGRPDPSEEERFRRLSKDLQISTSLPSERATSYVSWSETQHSPDVNVTRNRFSNVEEGGKTFSSTPESIRRKIEATGIFRDTGIRDSASTRRVKMKDPLPEDDRKEQTKAANECRSSEQHASSPVLCTEPRRSARRDVENTNEFEEQPPTAKKSEPTPGVFQESDFHRNQKRAEELPDAARNELTGNVTNEHLDNRHGWHQRSSPVRPSSQNPASMTRSVPVHEKAITPTSREQIAKAVRIKRPLPATLRRDAAILQPILENETEALEELDCAQKDIQTTAQDDTSNLSGLVYPGSYVAASLEHNNVLGIPTQHISSMGPAPAYNVSSKTASEFHSGPIQMATTTKASSKTQSFQPTRELNGNNSQRSHYLGLPLRGGTLVRPYRSPTIEVQPIYMTQIKEPIMYSRPLKQNEFVCCRQIEDNLDIPDTHSPLLAGEAQHGTLHNQGHGSFEDEGDNLVENYDSPGIQDEAEVPFESRNWETNSENYQLNPTPQIYDNSTSEYQNPDQDYAGYYGSLEERCPDEKRRVPQMQDMTSFWRPQWQY